jgi:transposase-like protein
MPVIINGETYYRTTEVCRKVGISRNTLFRWLKEGMSGEPESRDRRGWRLFTEKEVKKLRTEATLIFRASDAVKRMTSLVPHKLEVK